MQMTVEYLQRGDEEKTHSVVFDAPDGYEGKAKYVIGLGRGVNAEGELSEQGAARVPVVLKAAQMLLRKTVGQSETSESSDNPAVIFTGYRSILQRQENIHPEASEGGAAKKLAHWLMEKHPKLKLSADILAEDESESTTANLVNTAQLVSPQEGDIAAVVSDALHFRFGRPQLIARYAMPGVEIIPVVVDMEYGKVEVAVEWVNTQLTRAMLWGAKPGDREDIMRRQLRFERAVDGLTSWLHFGGSRAYADS